MAMKKISQNRPKLFHSGLYQRKKIWIRRMKYEKNNNKEIEHKIHKHFNIYPHLQLEIATKSSKYLL